MKNTDMKAIDQIMADGFQSVHEDGASNRAQEIELISKLNMSDYTLTDIKASRSGPVMIVTYFVSVEETIEGNRLTKNPGGKTQCVYSDRKRVEMDRPCEFKAAE